MDHERSAVSLMLLVNGQEHRIEVRSHHTLLEALRKLFRLQE